MAGDLRDQLQQALGAAYTLERELGGGGMSRVFVAHETRLGRKVVVKLLSPELAAGVSVERFEREIRVAASLQQANIVPVLSAGEANGLPYYTMPFVEGESLRARLARDGERPVTEIVRILGDVARALAYAHDHGVVHRDIKPDNVLLSGGTAVVTDFGIAKAISAARRAETGATLTQLGTTLGTPAYMAPEQAAGDPDVDHRADIYAFGCMAYELLVGRPPFDGRTPQRVLAAHMGESPRPVTELRPDTPPVLAELVMRSLAKEASDRPQNAADVMRVLDSVTSGSAVTAMPSILLGGRAMVWRALLLWAGAVIVVAVVARAAIVGIGLPDWVLPGAVIVMLLGLPVILFTGYVHRATYRALTATPVRTPGGGTQGQGTLATLAIKASPHVSWRRTAFGVLWAVGAFIALVGVFMLMRTLGIGPAGTLLSAGRLQARDRIVLTDFRVSNADSTLGRVASDAVRQGLSESSAINLMSAPSVVAALQRMQRPPTTVLDLALARDLAQREGAKAVIDGEVAGVGDGYIVTLRLVTADSGSLLTSATASGDGSKGFIDAIDKVTRTLRAKVGESLRTVQNAPALAQVTTSSLAALRKYSEAFRANAAGEQVRAVALARQAIAADSTFAFAWRLLGIAMSNAGMPRAPVDTALARAYQLRDRLTERERLWASGDYYLEGPGRDREKAIAALQALMAAGDTSVAGNNLGLAYTSRRQFDLADSMFRLSIGADSSLTFPYDNRAAPLVSAGKATNAEAAIDLYRTHFRGREAATLQRFTFLANEGRLDEVRAAADSLDKTGDSRARSWALGTKATLALMGGRPADAQRFAHAAASVDSARGLQHMALDDSIAAARLDVVVRGDPARAVRRMDAALARLPMSELGAPDRPYFDVASLYAIAGHADKAKGVLASWDRAVTDSTLRRSQMPAYNRAQGEIALCEKRYPEAITDFRRGDSLPDGPTNMCTICLSAELARAFDAAGQPDSAIAQYEHYLSTPFWGRFEEPLDPSLLAFTHKRLGELYEQKGDLVKALDHYRQFVDLWKNAEPELQPQVADARKRIARLTEELRQRG